MQLLPWVNERIATSIIENRPYANIEDLDRAWGIGPSKIQSIRPFVKIVPQTLPRASGPE